MPSFDIPESLLRSLRQEVFHILSVVQEDAPPDYLPLPALAYLYNVLSDDDSTSELSPGSIPSHSSSPTAFSPSSPPLPASSPPPPSPLNMPQPLVSLGDFLGPPGADRSVLAPNDNEPDAGNFMGDSPSQSPGQLGQSSGETPVETSERSNQKRARQISVSGMHDDPTLSKRARLNGRAADADDGGDGGGGGGGPGPVNWGPECNRKGDRVPLQGEPVPRRPAYDADFVETDDGADPGFHGDHGGGDNGAHNHHDGAHDTHDTSHTHDTHEDRAQDHGMDTDGNARNSGADKQRAEDDRDTHDDDYDPRQDTTAGKGAGKGQGRGRGKGRGGRKPKPTKDAEPSWRTDGTSPPLSSIPARHLLTMGNITSEAHWTHLTQLVQVINAETAVSANSPPHVHIVAAGPAEIDPIAAVVAAGHRCDQLERNTRLNDYNLMCALIQLKLRVEIVQRSHRGSKQCPSQAEFATRIDVSPSKFREWMSQGTRLVYLVAAGTPHILLIIAALGMRAQLTRRGNTTNQEIFGLAWALRNPQEDEHGEMVKTVLLPALAKLHREAPLALMFPFYSAETGEVEIYSVTDVLMTDLDKKFNMVTTNYFPLPDRGHIWSSSTNIQPPTPANIINDIAETLTIKLSQSFAKTKCPVTKANREKWTDDQRRRAGRAERAADLKELKAKLSDPKPRGHGQYVQIDSDSCEGKTLMLHDAKDKFVALLVTHMAARLQGCNDKLIAQLKSILPGELHNDKSDRQNYNFLALHFSQYARYSEKGDGAPRDIHPNYVYKDGKEKVNHSQRVPRPSKDIQNDPGKYNLLAEFLRDIIEFVNTNLKHHLPKEYDKLKIYVEHLPLDEDSPAYPFGGFVINICVSTHAHRDLGDKILCVVIPFGPFTGGELCLHEPGLVFKLAPGDILVFPSCDFTHFNLHFEGVRASIVLHSDKQGDGWVANANGWWVVRMYNEDAEDTDHLYADHIYMTE